MGLEPMISTFRVRHATHCLHEFGQDTDVKVLLQTFTDVYMSRGEVLKYDEPFSFIQKHKTH